MAVTVKLSSSLRTFVEGYDPFNGLTIDLRPNETVSQLLKRLGVPEEKVKIIMVDGRSASPDRVLTDGERLSLFPPVGGG